jgi:ribosomal protein L20A (L18A)
MTKLHETPKNCPALAEAFLPNGQTLFCQFDSYDDLKNFQIESGGKPCVIQYDRDNNVKLIEHNYLRDSLDWTKDWELKDREGINDYLVHHERPWHLLKELHELNEYDACRKLFDAMCASKWNWDNRKILIKFIREISPHTHATLVHFDIHELQYPVVNQKISQGLNESMGVIV